MIAFCLIPIGNNVEHAVDHVLAQRENDNERGITCQPALRAAAAALLTFSSPGDDDFWILSEGLNFDKTFLYRE